MKVKVKLPKPRKEPPPPPPDGPKPPTRLARMLALAHLIERRVESGALKTPRRPGPSEFPGPG